MIRILVLTGLALAPADAFAARAKDLGDFLGQRENQLSGAGLVVGLRRSGDSTRNEAAIRTLANRLQGLGASLQLDEITSRNAALVMVTATLPPSGRTGSRIDVTVASTGDALSLEGGLLLLTPLVGTDGQVYAVAEGSLVVGGYTAEQDGSGTRKNTPTVGRVVGGAIIEREIASSVDWTTASTVDFVLREADFTTAARFAASVDTAFGSEVATAISASTVRLTIPADRVGAFPEFAAQVEAVSVEVDSPARIVVNERTGSVVMGADVRVSAVAVAHGGLTIEVRRSQGASQPMPFSAGRTTKVSNSDVAAQEQEGRLSLVEGVEIGALVTALNDLGVTPRDLIVILELIKAAGALQATVETL